MKTIIVLILWYTYIGNDGRIPLPSIDQTFASQEMSKCKQEGKKALQKSEAFAWQCVSIIDMDADHDDTPLFK